MPAFTSNEIRAILEICDGRYLQFRKVHPGIPSGVTRFFWHPYFPRTDSATLTLSGNNLYFIPVFLPTITLNRIGITVTTLEASKNARLGIYQGGFYSPSTLLLDAGTVSLASTGDQLITINQAVTEGWYLLALVSNATGTAVIRAASDMSGTNYSSMTITGGTGSSSLPQTFGQMGFTYGSLPSTIGNSLSSSAVPPHIFVRGTG